MSHACYLPACLVFSAPMLESRYFAMNLLPETIGKMEGDPCDITGKYVEAVLRKTVAKTGNKIKVAEMWNEACLSWKTFLPEDKIDDFLSKRKIKEVSQPQSLSFMWDFFSPSGIFFSGLGIHSVLQFSLQWR